MRDFEKKGLKFGNGGYNVFGGGLILIEYLLLNIDYWKRGKNCGWVRVAFVHAMV